MLGPLLTVLLANMLRSGALAFAYLAVARLLGQTVKPLQAFWPLAAVCVIAAALLEDRIPRAALLGLVYAVQSGQILVLLLAAPPGPGRAMLRLLALVVAASCAAFVARSTVILHSPELLTPSLVSSGVQSVTLLTGVAAIVLGTLAFSGIRRNRYDEHMTRLATRDALTGIFNRGTLMDLGHKSVSAAVRARQPVSVLMLDLDHFKRVNDRFGHACGDRMLEQVTGIVAEKLREEDVLGRYGGEEFCVVLPNTDTEGARITSERIRTAIEAHEFELGTARTRITVSIGVATLAPTGSATLESLVMRADAALYQAKRRGRNRVVIAAPEASPAPGAAGAP